MNKIGTQTKHHPKPIFTLDVSNHEGHVLRLQFQDWSSRHNCARLLEDERPDLVTVEGGPGTTVLGTARDGVDMVNGFFRIQETLKALKKEQGVK